MCRHALDKHDEDGVCKHDCDECAQTGFQIDARVSPDLTEADVVALVGYIDQDFSTIEHRDAEILLGKVAFHLFGRTLEDLLKAADAAEGGEAGR